jgi:hypothetical protein
VRRHKSHDPSVAPAKLCHKPPWSSRPIA